MSRFITQQRLVVSMVIAGVALAAGAFGWWSMQSNEIAFLSRSPGATWIVPPLAASPDMYRDQEMQARFRCSFRVAEKPEKATLRIRAFRGGRVNLNGQEIAGLGLDGAAWKQAQQAPVAAWLNAGINEIEVTVTNRLGPPALWLRLDLPQGSFSTDASWEVAQTNDVWQTARPASMPIMIEPGSYLDGQATIPALLREGCWVVAIFAFLAAGGGWLLRKFHLVTGATVSATETWVSRGRPGLSVRRAVAWVFTGAKPALVLVCLVWLALFINNLPQLPRLFGFDAEGHEEYIRYIQKHGALPLADEGWQMYQPPLYYLVAAGVLELGTLSTADEAAVFLLRGLNGMVGLVHCALVFFCLRQLFPEQRWKQAAGTLFAGFLPAHLCLSHYVTNETLAATFVTAAVYFSLRAFRLGMMSPSDENAGREIRCALYAGLALGLALLTKFSAILALPVLAVALLWPPQLQLAEPSRRSRWLFTSVFLVAVAGVCGWHYARVWLHFGQPLVGNWDAVSGFAWWQLPGYHTVDYYTRFGEVFSRPLFSSFFSFADGIYATLWGDGLASSAAWMAFRPPWNYQFMGMTWVLGAVATGLIGLGFVCGLSQLVRKADAQAVLFMGMVVVFACGVVYMSLRVPSYAQVKAFYGLPALLPLTVLLLAGWEWLTARLRWCHAVLWMWFATWIFCIVVAFWIRPGNPETHVAKAIWALDQGRIEDAVAHFSRAVELNAGNWAVKAGLSEAVRVRPTQPALRGLLATVLQSQGQAEEAVRQYREALQLSPREPALLNNLAWILATHPDAARRDGAEAVRLAQQACELTGRREPLFLGTLAAAYAEAGRYAEAVAAATQAGELAAQLGNSALAKKNAELADIYRAGKSWRER